MASSEPGQNRAPLDDGDVVIVITYAPEPSQKASGSLHGRAMRPPAVTAAIALIVPSVIVGAPFEEIKCADSMRVRFSALAPR
jgi:hypothetical protein